MNILEKHNLDEAQRFIDRADALLVKKAELQHESNIYRNAKRHGILTALRELRWSSIENEIKELTEEITFQLNCADAYIGHGYEN